MLSSIISSNLADNIVLFFKILGKMHEQRLFLIPSIQHWYQVVF